MKNKYVYVLILLITAFALSLTACSSGTAAATGATTGITEESVQKQTEQSSTTQESSTTVPTTTAAPKKAEAIDSFKVKYIGNSCFYIEASNGTKIIADPYDPVYDNTFAPFPDIRPDLLTISHSHNDHSGFDRFSISRKIKAITPKVLAEQTAFDLPNDDLYIVFPECLKKEINIGGITITGYPSKHDADENFDNTIFVFKAGDLKLVHMGCTDNIVDPDALEAIKNADAMITYTGEQGLVTNKDIFAFVEKMNIKTITPHHYSMGEFPFYGSIFLDQVIKEVPKDMKVVKADELIVKKGMKKEFVVLSPMGKK